MADCNYKTVMDFKTHFTLRKFYKKYASLDPKTSYYVGLSQANFL